MLRIPVCQRRAITGFNSFRVRENPWGTAEVKLETLELVHFSTPYELEYFLCSFAMEQKDTHP